MPIGGALAQDTQPAPTFASTRAAKASASQQGGTWYVDMGSDKNAGFVLEQRGSMVLLKVDGSDNVLSLMPVPGQRGDTFFMDYAGRMVLRVTQQTPRRPSWPATKSRSGGRSPSRVTRPGRRML